MNFPTLIHDKRTEPVRGVAGQGFLQAEAVRAIEVTLAEKLEAAIDWTLQAENVE